MTGQQNTPTGEPASGTPDEGQKPPAAGEPQQKTSPSTGEPSKDTKTDDEQLGEGGKKALHAEREERKAMEKRLAALAPLQQIAEALGKGDPQKGTSEIEQLTERLSQHEKTLAEERAARWRAEVAHEHGFTAEQAAELRGETREELAAHAARLRELFPATAKSPKPDPRQGGGGGGGIDIDSRIKDAQSKGDWRTVISLQNQKLVEQANQ